MHRKQPRLGQQASDPIVCNYKLRTRRAAHFALIELLRREGKLL